MKKFLKVLLFVIIGVLAILFLLFLWLKVGLIKSDIFGMTYDFDGVWRQTNNLNEDSYHEAIIDGDTISISLMLAGGDMETLYWYGTFDTPEWPTFRHSWVSKHDKDETYGEIFASVDSTKKFVYKNGKITYTFSILGGTSTIELERVK